MPEDRPASEQLEADTHIVGERAAAALNIENGFGPRIGANAITGRAAHAQRLALETHQNKHGNGHSRGGKK